MIACRLVVMRTYCFDVMIDDRIRTGQKAFFKYKRNIWSANKISISKDSVILPLCSSGYIIRDLHFSTAIMQCKSFSSLLYEVYSTNFKHMMIRLSP